MLLRRTISPSWVIFKTPELLSSGVSLLATQTIASVDIRYHIPKYRPFELPRLKNLSSKVLPGETKVSPSLMEWLGVRASNVAENLKKQEKKQYTKRGLKTIIV